MLLASLSLIAALDVSDPCSLLRRADVEKILHWHAAPPQRSTYRLPQTSGSLCTYDANEGTVLITLPDHGSSFFQNNDLVDPFKNGLGLRVSGIGASAELFDDTAYLSKHGQGVSIAVRPNDGATDVASLTALAKIVARRMP